MRDWCHHCAPIALEKHLPDSTLSRGIVINLRRKLPHEFVQRLRRTVELHQHGIVNVSTECVLDRVHVDFQAVARKLNPVREARLQIVDKDLRIAARIVAITWSPESEP